MTKRADRRHPAVGRRRPLFRPEIEGLRAVAVLLVVADHLAAWPHGGFVGVDVFFVISGFLITGLLVNEHDRTGRISIKSFYQRRIRRILPGAITVLACTWVVSGITFYAARARDVHGDIAWSAAFLANVRFARTGTDYFNADKPASPVQHLWSLAVEEQFYLVWPLMLIVLLGVAGRLAGRYAKPLVLAMIVVLVAALFMLAVDQTRVNRTTAYFNTSTRAWELGVGAVLAFALPYLRRLSPWLCSCAIVSGLAAILVSAARISTASAFPAPVGAAPVLGAALVILGTARRRVSPMAWPLVNPVSRYIGRVSYSLYLWHWPTIIVLSAETSPRSGSFKALAILIMAALTVASYHLVEAPLRGFHWRDLCDARRRSSRWNEGWTEKRRAAFAGVVMAELAAVVWIQRPESTPKTFSDMAFVPATAAGSSTAARLTGAVRPPKDIADDIASALGATSWPKLSPGLGQLAKGKAPEWKRCGNVGPGQVSVCTFAAPGPAARKRTAVVLGDSIAISWLPAIRAALQPKGYAVVALTFGQCPATDVNVDQAVGAASTFTASCNRHRAWTFREIGRRKPDLVVISDAENSLGRLSGNATGRRAASEWRAGITRTLVAVRAAGARRTVVLSPPPAAEPLEVCATADSTPGDCVSRISATWKQMADAERAGAAATQADYLDTELFFCSANGYCPAFIGSTPIRLEGDHLVAAYARRIGRALTSRLTV